MVSKIRLVACSNIPAPIHVVRALQVHSYSNDRVFSYQDRTWRSVDADINVQHRPWDICPNELRYSSKLGAHPSVPYADRPQRRDLVSKHDPTAPNQVVHPFALQVGPSNAHSSRPRCGVSFAPPATTDHDMPISAYNQYDDQGDYGYTWVQNTIQTNDVPRYIDPIVPPSCGLQLQQSCIGYGTKERSFRRWVMEDQAREGEVVRKAEGPKRFAGDRRVSIHYEFYNRIFGDTGKLSAYLESDGCEPVGVLK